MNVCPIHDYRYYRAAAVTADVSYLAQLGDYIGQMGNNGRLMSDDESLPLASCLDCSTVRIKGVCEINLCSSFGPFPNCVSLTRHWLVRLSFSPALSSRCSFPQPHLFFALSYNVRRPHSFFLRVIHSLRSTTMRPSTAACVLLALAASPALAVPIIALGRDTSNTYWTPSSQPFRYGMGIGPIVTSNPCQSLIEGAD